MKKNLQSELFIEFMNSKNDKGLKIIFNQHSHKIKAVFYLKSINNLQIIYL